MNYWLALSIGASLLIGLIGIGLAATGRPFIGISMAVFSVATAHMNSEHLHE